MDGRVPTGLTRAEKRKFGFTVGPAFVVVAAIVWWRGHTDVAVVLATIGAVLAGLAVVAPVVLGPVYRGWMALGLALSRVVTPVVLALMYFLIFLPFGVVMRALGHNPMVREDDGSYWIERPETERRSNLNRQF